MRIKVFRHFPNTMITIECFYFFKLLSLFRYFAFAYFFSYTTIFKAKENVVPCDKHINWNYWRILNLYIFSDIKETPRGWGMNLKSFWCPSPYSSLVMKVGLRTIDRPHQIYLRQRGWAMELIVVVGTSFR